MEKNKVAVEVNGKEYAMLGVESEEYLFRVGSYVSKKVDYIVETYPRISTTEAAVMAALTIADELLKLRDEGAAMDAKINSVLSDGHNLQEQNTQKQTQPTQQKQDTRHNRTQKDVFIPRKFKSN